MPHGLDYSLILNNGTAQVNFGYNNSNNSSMNELNESTTTPTTSHLSLSGKLKLRKFGCI